MRAARVSSSHWWATLLTRAERELLLGCVSASAAASSSVSCDSASAARTAEVSRT